MAKLNTNSNSYIIIYSAILVVIVAFLLAFVYQALKPMQDANVALDKKKQILAALNIRNLSDADAAAKYKEIVEADYILDAQGECENIPEDLSSYDGESAGFKLNSADYKAGKLALYICKVDGQYKYVIPVYGMGLWGAIWGYVAINNDMNTVYGAYFDHEGETAGLGAEIKDDVSWQEKFIGKEVMNEPDNEAIQVVLGVKKLSEIKNQKSEVDAITGATLTSNGVNDMLKDCLGKYKQFFIHNGWGGK